MKAWFFLIFELWLIYQVDKQLSRNQIDSFISCNFINKPIALVWNVVSLHVAHFHFIKYFQTN
jgi:fumarate reductase subunit C